MANVRNSSMSIFGALALSTAIGVVMMGGRERRARGKSARWLTRCVESARMGRVGVICVCLAKASDPNNHKQPSWQVLTLADSGSCLFTPTWFLSHLSSLHRHSSLRWIPSTWATVFHPSELPPQLSSCWMFTSTCSLALWWRKPSSRELDLALWSPLPRHTIRGSHKLLRQ